MSGDNRKKNELVVIFVIRFLGLLGLAGLYSLLFFLAGCQQDEFDVDEASDDLIVKQDSRVTKLLQRIALKDGSSDNIIDQSSCISLDLPVTVVINNQKITVELTEDFLRIERLFDEHEYDESDLDIVFPITVILADHSKVEINDEDEWEDLKEHCVEGGEDDDIECADLQYPMSISLYDSENQVSDVITIKNDKSLFRFIEGLEEGDLFSVDFPVVMELYDGKEVKVNNNKELEEVIEDIMDACDEDDDNDFNDDDADDSGLVQALTKVEWEITHYYDEQNMTSGFIGFTFMFYEDGKLEATDGYTTIKGTWVAHGDDGSLHIILDFELIALLDDINAPFDELNEEWDVIEWSDTKIKLEDSSGGDDVELVFERL